jgi:hypothetical protein
MDPHAYGRIVGARLGEAGYAVDDRYLASLGAVSGYRSEFRLRWGASKLHLFVTLGTADVVTAEALAAHLHATLEHAKLTKGGARGLHSGVAAVAALVGNTVEPAAEEYARTELVRDFAAFAWPVCVDLAGYRRTTHEGNPYVGRAFTGWIREQIGLTLPEPWALDPTTASA